MLSQTYLCATVTPSGYRWSCNQSHEVETCFNDVISLLLNGGTIYSGLNDRYQLALYCFDVSGED